MIPLITKAAPMGVSSSRPNFSIPVGRMSLSRMRGLVPIMVMVPPRMAHMPIGMRMPEIGVLISLQA